MLVKELFEPRSIVVVGGSNDLSKPGGRVVKHLKDGGFLGELYIINPKVDLVQGIKALNTPEKLPQVDLAIIAIASKYVPETIEFLAHKGIYSSISRI